MEKVRQAIELIGSLSIEGKEDIINTLQNSLNIPVGSKVKVTLGETTCIVLVCNLGKISGDTYKINLINLENGERYSSPRNLKLHTKDGELTLTYEQFKELLSYDQDFQVLNEKENLLDAFINVRELFQHDCEKYSFCTGCPFEGFGSCSRLEDYINEAIGILEEV